MFIVVQSVAANDHASLLGLIVGPGAVQRCYSSPESVLGGERALRHRRDGLGGRIRRSGRASL